MVDGLQDALERSVRRVNSGDAEHLVEERLVTRTNLTQRAVNGIELIINLVLSPYHTRVHGTYETISRYFGAIKDYLNAKKLQYASAYAEFKELMTYSAQRIRDELLRFINILERYSNREAEERDRGIAHFKKAVRYLRGRGYKVRFIFPPNNGEIIGRFFYKREEVGSFIWGELGKCVNLSNDSHWRLVRPLEEVGYPVSRQPKL